ncbi:hypothetical protein BKP35_08930 [Anaerobacillus arseniciselenatis]|uniref:Uncharacterized protein n=1 Tax=Anaerobacillus arseniciselenatis TaxID=85682 RepID=A0A1S2LMD9_9BACI|nr:hypothetical protein [Anaerobacillus arseniciselenatis]OIJ13526.1 hypothetical protein BKP35_08930 [Anaerobacillus arseniciselenatis]
MDLPTIISVYFGLLLVGVLLSGLIGFYFSRKLNSNLKGFIVLITLSVLLFASSIWWFHITSTAAFIGTISWLSYIGMVVILYPIYLMLAWFLIQKVNKNYLFQ